MSHHQQLQFDLGSVAAASHEGVPILGHLVWYTLSECFIDRATLRDYLDQVGLSDSCMPAEIRMPDAFRKASSAAEKKRVPSNLEGMFHNYLIREVASDNKSIVRHVVLETVDAKNKRLAYQSDAAKIILNRDNGTIESFTSMPDLEAVCEQIRLDYQNYLDHHDSSALRRMLYGILSGMAPINVRPSGGVYFVPAMYQDDLRKMINLVGMLGKNSEGFMVPMMDTRENRDMVRSKLTEHLRSTLSQLARVLKGEESKSLSNQVLAEGKQALQDFQSYQQTLGSEVDNMQTMVSFIRQQMESLVNKLVEAA
ncbi:MAG: DUF6744 family protein [Bacillota bacterium]